MTQLARRLQAVKPSPTLSLNAKARALSSKGADVVSFAAGEPDFDTPAHIKNAAKAALDSGFTKYTATGGIPELKSAIAEKLKKENRLEYTPEQILVSTGAKHSINNIMQALLSHVDEVINVFGLAIRHGLTARDLKSAIFAYPTGASDVGYML